MKVWKQWVLAAVVALVVGALIAWVFVSIALEAATPGVSP